MDENKGFLYTFDTNGDHPTLYIKHQTPKAIPHTILVENYMNKVLTQCDTMSHNALSHEISVSNVTNCWSTRMDNCLLLLTITFIAVHAIDSIQIILDAFTYSSFSSPELLSSSS